MNRRQLLKGIASGMAASALGHLPKALGDGESFTFAEVLAEQRKAFLVRVGEAFQQRLLYGDAWVPFSSAGLRSGGFMAGIAAKLSDDLKR